MASLREVIRPLRKIRVSQLSRQIQPLYTRRWSSTEAAPAAPAPAAPAPADVPAFLDLEQESSMAIPGPSAEQLETFGDPLERSQKRKLQLPGSRYNYHPPTYKRGELHPIQSPLASDPIARDYEPGPFNFPRLKETWQTTICPDILTLTYNHKPPGTPEKVIGERLRSWDGSSPYHKNRPLRGPRGGTTLRQIEKDITYRNIPEIKSITIATYQPKGIKNREHLLAARAAVQAITGVVPTMTFVKKGVAQWGIMAKAPSGAKATVYGNDAYELLDKIIHLVLPKIKDWSGVLATTGDETGGLAFGFDPEQVRLFPEIEANADMYPTRTIPGCRILIDTTARSDRHCRLLMQTLGLPFFGEFP